jgi:hypothetical protein
MKKNLFLVLVLVLGSCSFKSDSEFIQYRFWKRGELGFIGLQDILILNAENFRNDTVFVDKKPVATFYKLDDFKTDLILKSIETSKLSTYHDQGKINEK